MGLVYTAVTKESARGPSRSILRCVPPAFEERDGPRGNQREAGTARVFCTAASLGRYPVP